MESAKQKTRMLIDRFIFQRHLEAKEQIFFTAHKHISEFTVPLARILFFGLGIPWTLYYAGFRSRLFYAVVIVWLVLAALLMLYDFIDWYADAWLFTNMGVIVIAWDGIFSNTSQRIGYEDAEGVAYEIKGFWGTVMRYGDITLKMVSGHTVTLKNAKSPKRIERAFIERQGAFMSAKEMHDASGLKQMISQMVAHHLRQGK